MNFNRFIMTTLGACAALCSWSSQAEAIAASVKSTGMAATAVAYPLDALAAAYNPAGAMEICDRLDVGGYWLHDQGHATLRGNTLDNPLPSPPFPPGSSFSSLFLGGKVNGKFQGFRSHNSYSGDFGFNKRLGCCNEWAVGVVFYNRNYSKTTYNKNLVLFGKSHAGLEYIHETLSPYVAYQWCDMNFGISVNIMAQRLKVNGLENFDMPSPPAPFGTSSVGHVTNKGYDYSWGCSFTLGWQWHVLDCVTIGLVYQPKTNMSRFDKYKGFLSHRGRLDIPPMYAGGIAWRALCNLVFAFDVQYYGWENVKALHQPLIHKGTLQPLGSTNGPGFGFRNQVFYRLGVDWQVSEELSLRAGYRYGVCPVRSSQTAVNALTLDTVEQFLTLGATYAINPCHELSGLFAYGFNKKVKGKGSIPPGIPNPTLAALLHQPIGFGGGEADLSANKYVVGISWGWNY